MNEQMTLDIMNESEQRNRSVTTPGVTQFADLIDNFLRFQDKMQKGLDLAGNTHTIDDVLNMVLAGRLSFITGPQSFVVLEIIPYPQFNVLHVFLAGGELKEVLNMQNMLVNLARQRNCKKITMTGRPGWIKYLERQGWQKVFVTMALDAEEAEDEQGG